MPIHSYIKYYMNEFLPCEFMFKYAGFSKYLTLNIVINNVYD